MQSAIPSGIDKSPSFRTTPFSKEKRAALGGTRTHDTLLSGQSVLPTELPGQLSRQSSPRAAPFSFEKGAALVGVVMHLPCTP